METHTRLEIEKRIHEEIAKTEEDIIRLSASTKPISPDNAIGRISRMEAIGARSIDKSALVRAKQRVAGLKSALANVHEPEFGTCFECGEPIPSARILLIPHSKMCVSCAEQAE